MRTTLLWGLTLVVLLPLLPSARANPARVAVSVVCAGTDRVLRAWDSAECPSHQSRISLHWSAGGTPDILQGPEDQAQGKKPTAQALIDIERRLDAIQFAPMFTVFDTRGGVLLEVRPQGLVLYNAGFFPGTHKAFAGIGTTAWGAFFRAASADGPWTATMEVSDSFNGVRIAEGKVARVELGRKRGPGYSFTVPSLGPAADPVAGLGESRAGSGALVLGDSAGHMRAGLTANQKAEVRIFGRAGDPLLSLREADNGAGLLVIGDSKGTPMVKLGVNDNRYGVVLAGPRSGFPLVTRSGLPGSYFLGCAGGDACGP
jgi:hypothetical protein